MFNRNNVIKSKKVQLAQNLLMVRGNIYECDCTNLKCSDCIFTVDSCRYYHPHERVTIAQEYLKKVGASNE